MVNIDSEYLHDENIDKEQYKKWTALRMPKHKKTSMHKNPYLVKKQYNKKVAIKKRDREFLEEIYTIPEKEDTLKHVNHTIIHPEIIKSIPSYTVKEYSAPTWYQKLFGIKNKIEKENVNDELVTEETLKAILKELK